MKQSTVTVTSASGLHARPAGLLCGLAQKYGAEIYIEKDGKSINGKSIMGILSLGTSKGDELVISADGHDEHEAVEAIVELFETKLAHE